LAKSSKSAATDILVVNGPNLNLLGRREPEVYGRETLADIAQAVLRRAAELGLNLDFRQSNHEGEIVAWIQRARDDARIIIINPGGLTHTSVVLLDALTFTELPVIEVHLSNIFRREPFRHHSYVSLAAKGVICGLGAQGYLLAVDAAAAMLKGDKKKSTPKKSRQGRS
jgi:3-dehydroquinate dehydratase-2